MALGGGTFTLTNKVLPGAYINFISTPRALGWISDRGVCAGALPLDWGSDEEIISIANEDLQRKSFEIFGYEYTHEKLLPIREILRGAKVLKLFKLNSGGDKASILDNGLAVTAVHAGVRGNDIMVTIEDDIDETTIFHVKTYLETVKIDEQSVKDIFELKTNKFVSFSGAGVPVVSSGLKLINGTNNAITGLSYQTFLSKIENEYFHTLFYAGTDLAVKALFDAFTKRLRDEDGYKIVTIMEDYGKSDFEGVISVKNLVSQDFSSVYKSSVWWVAGQSAGSSMNETLTNKIYDGELDINTSFTKRDYEKFIQQGYFCFYSDIDRIVDTTKTRVLMDINSFTAYEPEKNDIFSHNRTIRVLDNIANDVARIFGNNYLGKVHNDSMGRNLFKAELINYFESIQGIRAIEDFSAKDIEVLAGSGKNDVIVNAWLKPIDAMEKLYMTVEVA